MNEELRETLEGITEVLEEVANEPSGNVIGKVVVAGATLIGAAGVAVVVKKRKAISKWNDERIIKKLGKKGYVVYHARVDSNNSEPESEESTEK